MVLKAMETLFTTELRGKISFQEPMRDHTSFRIGGPCDIFFQPEDLDDLRKAVNIAGEHKIPYFVLGGGSNLLVADDGIDGLVIKLGKAFSHTKFFENFIVAGAGLSNSAFLQQVIDKEIARFEFLAGIPGSVGGALMINAGTYLGEMVQVIKEAIFLTETGEIKNIKAGEMGLAYRTSTIPKNWIALELTFTATQGKREEIIAKVNELKEKRKASQPLTYPNAGSIFKNPPGQYAWKLIDAAGGRGLQHGNAQLSEKHTNFIVNLGDARASDVITLMKELQHKVEDKFNVHLVPEIAFVGCWKEESPNELLG